jgi:hypothetical protein
MPQNRKGVEMHIAEKYIVLIIAIRFLEKGNINRKEVQDILHLPIFKEELFYDVELYAKLIQAIIDEEALECINNFLNNREVGIMYSEDIEANFRTLKGCFDEKYFLLHKIEEQLMYQLYCHMEGGYVYHKLKSIDYLCKHEIIYRMRVFKENGTVINKSTLLLNTVIDKAEKDVGQMERFIFRF